jgi:hypothetical protein
MATRKTLIPQDPRATGIDPLAADSVAKTTAVPTESTQTADQVAEANKEDTVLANVEKPFKLTDNNHVVHNYVPGANKMPRSHAEHWFAKVHGTAIIE